MTRRVVTSEWQAAQAGETVLREGGNAVDAAIATAACLTVTEPTSNGLGGDCFALVHDGERIHALASHGASPAAFDLAAVRAEHAQMPVTGPLPITVPGQVAGWQALLERLGTWNAARVLQPAIDLASGGFTVGPVTAAAWARSVARLRAQAEWARVFLDQGAPPAAGDVRTAPDHAATLRALSTDGLGAMYVGDLSRRIAAATPLTEADLGGHRAHWVTPLQVAWGDWQVVGMTAPTQGVVALQALAMLHGRPSAPHHQIEAIKLAFGDAYAHVADPDTMSQSIESLLDPERVRDLSGQIGPAAAPPPPPSGMSGGTVLLCVDDGDLQVSFIQSNFMGFGSGVVVPGTGIAMQNRGAGFVLDPSHPNCAAGGKRPFHTILPGLITERDGRPLAAFGCMGGQMQPQGHVQLVSALGAGRSPAQAVAAPRWRWTDAGELWLEQGFDPRLAADLMARGHPVRSDVAPTAFGGAQIVLRTSDGLQVGTDPRKDGERLP